MIDAVPCGCTLRTRCPFAQYVCAAWPLVQGTEMQVSLLYLALDQVLAIHLQQAGVSYVRKGNLSVPPWQGRDFPTPE
jgi:hypothetical protein